MKTLLAILVAAGIGFAAAYAIVSSQSSARLKEQQAAFDAQKAQLESDLAAADAKPARVRTVEIQTQTPGPAVPYKLTPQEILDKLIEIHPGSGTNGTRTIRLVVFYLESLADCGQAALPVIDQFFARNVDVDYTQDDGGGGGNQQQGRGNPFAFRRGGQLRTDFVLPPSLRLGLVDVVSQIGGEDAEKILANVLATTGRGVEVTYVTRKLEEMTPGKYREIACSAAKDLLSNPIMINNPDRLDQNTKGYLYGVLEMYGDTSFVGTAQSQLITANGGIDNDALNYITRVLKDQSVSILSTAYNDSRLTNRFQRTQIANQVLGYAGLNSQANAMFKDIVTSTDGNPGQRMFAIARLAGGGFGPGRNTESPTDPKEITARMQLLDSVKPGVTDERELQVINMTSQNLQNLLDGKPVENQNPFGRGGRGLGGGGRGQRGQPGNQNGANPPTDQPATF